MCDTDNSSQISKEELEAAAVALGFETNKDATNAIFLAMDEDGSGEIDFEEFLVYLCGPPPEDGAWDASGEGEAEGEPLTPEQEAAMRSVADRSRPQPHR